MRQGMCIVHEHVRNELKGIKVDSSGKMQSEPLHQINIEFGKNKARRPAQEIDYDQMLGRCRQIEKPRTILKLHVFFAAKIGHKIGF
jgi:hypothetical protein